MDARIPVRFGVLADATPGDALLIEAAAPPPGIAAAAFEVAITGHPAACDCCRPRNAAGTTLAHLFERRARGEVAFFRRILAVTTTAEGDVAVWTALRSDPVASVRFRPDEHSAECPDRPAPTRAA